MNFLRGKDRRHHGRAALAVKHIADRNPPATTGMFRIVALSDEEAKVQAGRRVSGHWVKVRPGQTGRQIVEEARAMRAEAIVICPSTFGLIS